MTLILATVMNVLGLQRLAFALALALVFADPVLDADAVLVEAGTDTDVGTFIQITDVHADLHYLPFTSSNCSAVDLCCHLLSEPLPGGETQRAGTQGDYLCDCPLYLAELLIKTAASLRPDFVIWSGDTPSHAVLSQSRTLNLEITSQISRVFKQYFPLPFPIFPSLGDHDTFPLDQLEPPPDAAWLFDGLALPVDGAKSGAGAVWSDWLDDEAVKTFRYGGYYRMDVSEQLTVLVTNPLYEVAYNAYVTLNETWAVSHAQRQFVVATLDRARAEKRVVYWISHIPTGHYTLLDTYQAWWTRVAVEYSDVIAAQMSGHTHTTQWRLFRPSSSGSASAPVPVQSLLIAGSGTSYQFLNPSLRVYDYDRRTGAVLDYTDYRCDLEVSNRAKKPCNFTQAYRFTALFAPYDLEPSSLAQLVAEMRSNTTLFDMFYRFVRCGGYPYLKPITDDVRRLVLCQLDNSERLAINECIGDEVGVFADPDYCPADAEISAQEGDVFR